MNLNFDESDEYAIALDSLSAALENSYKKLREGTFSCDNQDYSKLALNRLRAFYCAQHEIKTFLGKQVSQAGSDFFVETILFALKLFNESESLNFEISSERTVKSQRKTIRPDVSIWKGETLVAAIECKTQLGWRRNNWRSHFDERQQILKTFFPRAKMFFMVMTNCNWSGFGNDSRVGEQLFCLLKDRWPTQIPIVLESSILESILDTPIENLLTQVKHLRVGET